MPGANFSQQLNNFAAAIRKRESEGTGGYGAVGVPTKHGRALGAYQIMSEFWPEWAAEAGIPGADWKDPAAQDHVAKYKMTQYYQKYGDWASVAAAWIGGPGGAADFRRGERGEPDALGTDVKSYVNDVVSNYLAAGGEATAEKGGSSRVPGGLTAPGQRNTEQYRQGQRLNSVPDFSVPLPGGEKMNSHDAQLQHQQAVESVLGAVSSVIAGGQRKPVEEVASFLPGGSQAVQDIDIDERAAMGDDSRIDKDMRAAGIDISEAHFEGLNPTFEEALNQLIEDAPGSVSINSGFRSIQRQKELWNQALKKYGDPEIADNWVARPGSSKHNHGLAADLAYESDEVKRWVHENAPKYGLHFPLSNEDWHIEPIGARQ